MSGTEATSRMPMRGFIQGWMLFRIMYIALLLGTVLMGIFQFDPIEMRRIFIAALILLVLSPLTVPLPFLREKPSSRAYKIIWFFLPIDLAVLATMTFSLHIHEDPIYPLFLGLALFYAVVIQRRWVRWLTVVIGSVYFFSHVAHWFYQGTHGADALLAFGKATAISLLGLFMGTWMEQRIERESAFQQSRDEVKSLNEELTRRLAELHVVAEITEVIHSTLDFDSIGPVVLDSLKKAIDIPMCSLMVVDRKTEATVFSASSGMDAFDITPTTINYPSGTDLLDESVEQDTMFTCTNIIEHNDMAVVFCCPADRLDGLTDDDMLVLQAVSSELVVAVENSQLYQLTKRLSITDELTGLKNYRFFQQRLDQEYERANRYNRYLSLLMLDVDHFKNFNDSYGHIAGDHALADLAGILSSCVREVDVVTRYGGEEFAVILPETDAAGAFVVAEKIREGIATFGFADPDGKHAERMTVSVGVATFPVHSLDREGLLRQADDALYQAKHFGRDRVRSPRITSDAPGS